ncbi:MAG: M20/M25/M40 family metallo-hydrolase [Clostridia bacterium]|nr:M20/M25/M40 family metallo-hydrolase [Clostridia bacterium]
MIALYIILGALVLFILIMVIRALLVKDTAEQPEAYEKPQIDLDAAVKKAQGAIRIPTISMADENASDKPFLDLQAYLEQTFPLFHQTAEKRLVDNYGLMYRIEGTDKSLLPGMFMGHQDVVPPQEEGWTHPPFAAEIEDGCIWGRGSFDMKSQLVSIFEATEMHLRAGKMPQRTMYFCFGYDEEIAGNGAKAMCKVLAEEGVRFEFIFDEGMNLLDASMIGIEGPLALVGVCEKGWVNAKITAKGKAGHAAMPPKETTAVSLAKAVVKLNKHQMKARFTPAVNMLIKSVCPRASFKYKLLMANADIFKPLLKPILLRISPATASLLRTTMAFTVLHASDAANVMPDESYAIVNCRVNLGEKVEDVKTHMQKVLGSKYEVELLALGQHEPTGMSDLDSFGWRMMQKTVGEVFPGGVTAPFPFVAGTDSKYYDSLTNCTFKFSPHITDAKYRAGMHNVNEYFKVSDVESDIQFYYRFMQNSCF